MVLFFCMRCMSCMSNAAVIMTRATVAMSILID